MTTSPQKYFTCYYCTHFQTDDDAQYQNHVEQRHPKKPVYPSRKYLKEHGIKRQNKIWEDLGIE
jgi:hypothetical protein